MINYVKAEKEFKKYLDNYDLEDGKIKLKMIHTFGVVSSSEYIAMNLDLSKEDIELAKVIALLHDIARFEQAKQFSDFRDYATLDHAELGVKILFDNNFIRAFVEDEQYDDIILKAIKNHNKLEIEGGLSDRELLHAKIIRDADKTDNFRGKSVDSFEDMFNSSLEVLQDSVITEKIYNDFMSNRTIVSRDRVTDMDHWVSYIAFIFDYNYTPGLQYIKDNNYINKVIDRIDYHNEDTKLKMENIRKYANDYIDMRLHESFLKKIKRR